METRAPLDVEMLCAQTPWLRALARHLVRDPARAEDIAQETLLAALQSPPADIVDVARLRAWLRRVAYNLSHLSARRNMRRRAREERVATSEVEVSTADLVLLNSIRTQLADAVDALEEPYRRTVELRYFEGASTADIATQMGTTDNAVRKRLFRARRKLRDSLDHAHRGERLAWFSALAPLTSTLTPPSLPTPGTIGGDAVSHASATLGTPYLGALAAAAVLAMGATLATLPERETVAPLVPDAAVRVAHVRTAATLDSDGSRRRVLPPVTAPGEGLPTALPTPTAEPLEEEAQPDSGAVATEDAPAQEPIPIHGLVVDLSGAPVANLAVQRTGSHPSATTTDAVLTDAQGRFTAKLPAEALEAGSLLSAGGHGWRTVRAASLDAASAGDPAPIVVARSVQVEGSVLSALGTSPQGHPVAGAHLRLVADERAFLAIDTSLAATLLARVEARTDASGRFHIPELPSGTGLFLEVRSPDLGTAQTSGAQQFVRVPVPSKDTSNWVVRLGTPDHGPIVLSGHVRLEDGSPSVDTLVRLGDRETRTDLSGRFGFRLQRFDPDTPLTAERQGFRQRLVPRLRTLLRTDPGPYAVGRAGRTTTPHEPHTVDLVLVESSATIEGRVVGPDGTPCSNWIVHALEHDVEHPMWTRASTDADGRFRLAHLTDGLHRVVAHDPETLATVEEDDVEPDGRTIVLAARALDELHDVRGTVVDGLGNPIPGARIAVARVLADSGARHAPREEHATHLHARTDSVVSDGQGSFLLERLPRAGAELLVLAGGAEHHVRLDDSLILGTGAELTLSIPRPASLRVRTPLASAVAFEVHDQAGRAVPLTTIDRIARRRVPLYGGESLAARAALGSAVPEQPSVLDAESHTIVLLDEHGTVVGHLPFEDARLSH